jgi:NADH dehydrogenase (ubiquinone) Fe-S protein 3
MYSLSKGTIKSPWGLRMDMFPNQVVISNSGSGSLESKTSNEVLVYVAPMVFPQVMLVRFGVSSFDFKQLVDMTAIDYPSRGPNGPRFDVVYQLVSIRYGCRCIVKVSVGEGDSIPSRTGRYASANWAERECYDMFGVLFEGHPDLRRILTDYGFEGHPIRKDFPLSGYTEVRYDEISKRVVNEPIERSQDVRMQEHFNTWKI